ncbi:hypothetical protein [Haloechinothrix alba]|uniref:hypothetical protein n=1 Tax=Haloechinothrix alba TaxID=664784 RepID=UPI0015961D6A|nr:hypothetical protein [Haloechinothrix alba]
MPTTSYLDRHGQQLATIGVVSVLTRPTAMLIDKLGQTFSDQLIGVTGRPLVDQRRPHVVIAYACHQILGQHTGFRRPDVARVPQVMKVQARESDTSDDLGPLDALIKGRR